jgi:hypothetical protein
VNTSVPGHRTLIAVGLGVLLVALLSVGVVLVAGSQPPHFATDSPEWTIQQYLAAWDRDDPEAAFTFFSERLHALYSLAAYERFADEAPYRDDEDLGSHGAIVIEGTDGSGDRRKVHLSVREVYGEGLEATTYSSPRSVRMVREGDVWRIDELMIRLQVGPQPTDGAPQTKSP